MNLLIFSTQSFERPILEEAARRHGHAITFMPEQLSSRTASAAQGSPAICAFVNDVLDEPALEALHAGGTRIIALRSAGFNHVDLDAAAALGLTVARVPAYSPYAVAEHTVGLMLALNRKLHRAHARTREGNFSLQGLMGFDMRGKTVGIIGTGEIGAVVAHILAGFQCRILAFDPKPNPACRDLGVAYVPLDELLAASDIITIHCPLNPATHHLISEKAISRMKEGVMLINTSRGAVVDTRAVIAALKSGRIGSLGLDVYEEEGDLFFRDLSDTVIQDDVISRLLTFPNVLITAHQGFFTREALESIAETTMQNLTGFEQGEIPAANLVTAAMVVR
jgi:D-lactate dehydrogenase